MANKYRNQKSANAAGHYASLWIPSGTSLIPTTITNQKKSHAKEIEAAKRAKILAEMEKLTGGPVSGYSHKIDGVNRRWTGVKGNGSDN
jgi:hypothetical protein